VDIVDLVWFFKARCTAFTYVQKEMKNEKKSIKS